MKPLALRLVGDTIYLRAAARDGPLTEHHRLALTGFQCGQLTVLLARFDLTDPPLQTKARLETVILMKRIARDLGFKTKIIKTHHDGWVTVAFTPLG